MSHLDQLGLFRTTLLNASGEPVVGGTVEVRWQGATVKTPTAGGAPPQTVTVAHRGNIQAGDTVELKRSGTYAAGTTYNVDSVTETTVVLSGSTIPSLAVGDRITVQNRSGGQPDLYKDNFAANAETNPITSVAGGLAQAYLQGGFYDYVSAGSNLTTRLIEDYYVSRPRWIYVDESPYNAAGDGTTDDLAALQHANSDANPGDIIVLGATTYGISDRIIFGNGVTVLSTNPAGSVIKALGSFPATGLAVVRLEQDRTWLHGVQVNCNDIAGTIGVQITGAKSGMDNCYIQRFVSKGIDVASSADQVVIDTVDLDVASAAASAKGIHFNSCGQVAVRSARINSLSGSGQQYSEGIHCQATKPCTIETIDVVGATDGIRIAQDDVSVDTVVGSSRDVDVVQIDATFGKIHLRNIKRNGATNTVNDLQLVVSSTATSIAHWVTGSTASANIITDDPAVTWRVPNPVRFGGAVTFDSGFTLASDVTISGRIKSQPFEALTAAATTSVTKNCVRFTAGSGVTITNINIDGGAPGATHDGYPLWLRNVSGGTVTLGTGGNIDPEGVGSFVMANLDSVQLRWDNGASQWTQARVT